jgi:hypothetical protein
VPHVLEDADLLGDFVHRQRAALQVAIVLAESTVEAVVAALVAGIQRREQDHAPAINALLDFAGGRVDVAAAVGIIDCQQRCDLVELQPLARSSPCQDIGKLMLVGRLHLAHQVIDGLRVKLWAVLACDADP